MAATAGRQPADSDAKLDRYAATCAAHGFGRRVTETREGR
jgi:hypothetical protein